MKKRFFLIFLLILISCIPTPIQNSNSKTIYLDQNFSKEERIQIIEGLDSWVCSTKGIFTYTLGGNDLFKIFKNMFDKDYISIEVVGADNYYIQESDARLPTYDGEVEYTNGLFIHGKPARILIVMDRVADGLLEPIIEHEIAHQMRISHSSSKNSIMYPDITKGARKITEEDIESFCRIYGCDSGELKVCNL